MFNLFDFNIISRKEKDILLKWIIKSENKFKKNVMGVNRKYYKFSHDPTSPKLLFEIKNRIFKREKIESWVEEPMYQDYVGWISDGGYIHKHKDANFMSDVGVLKSVRYNLFLSVPHEGGDVIYGERNLKIKEGKYIKCNSGTEYHECSVVKGKKPRIVVSYGVLIR